MVDDTAYLTGLLEAEGVEATPAAIDELGWQLDSLLYGNIFIRAGRRIPADRVVIRDGDRAVRVRDGRPDHDDPA